MANFVITVAVDNNSGTTAYKYLYRVSGTSLWTTFQTSGGTATPVGFVGIDNTLYDIQVVNVSATLGNPTSAIIQDIHFTDPGPVISPTNSSVGYYFGNLGASITDYVCTLSLFSAPGEIIATHTLSPTTLISDTFVGLSSNTQYYLTITPPANQFSKTFIYTFTTSILSSCPDPQNIIVTLA